MKTKQHQKAAKKTKICNAFINLLHAPIEVPNVKCNVECQMLVKCS